MSLDECDYLRDYFDEERTDQNFQRNSCRIYIIYPFINDKGVLDPVDLDGLRRIMRDLLQTIEALRTSELGHGHISLGQILLDSGDNLQLWGAGMKQLVKKAQELGFTVIGFQQEESLAWDENRFKMKIPRIRIQNRRSALFQFANHNTRMCYRICIVISNH